MEKTIHQGRNVKRFREMLGIKQEALAIELGADWNQRKISLLEQKDVIDEDLLSQVAKVLKVPVEAIKNFDEEAAINVIGNNYHDNSTSNVNYHCTFNPIDKIVELYDALVKSEKEKIELMQKIFDKMS
jgi:transcriptional regulator with XRE-family HTH domain